MKLTCPELYDDDINEEEDGTFTLSFSPWIDESVKGIPTKQLAREIAHAAHDAMQEYGRHCMIED